MDVLCQEFKDHYHLERPHHGLDNGLIVKSPGKNWRTRASDKIRLSSIRCEERLGGLLKSYSFIFQTMRRKLTDLTAHLLGSDSVR
jgi:putative transposase